MKADYLQYTVYMSKSLSTTFVWRYNVVTANLEDS